MLIKAFPHGKGGGSSPVEYLLRLDYHGRKENPPEVLRGDPLVTKDLIDSIDREWKFTSGVCSWSREDEVTPEQIEEVMDKFEEVAFAGLDPDQHNILWVHHTHVNRCELHFVIPRMELSTGNAFNAFPPGWQKDFDPLRDYENIKHNWTRPNDPDRARMFTPSNADIIEARLTRWGQNPTKAEKEQARDVINNYIKELIENDIIKIRSDITTSLREIGLDINRESKSYITVKDSTTNQKIRLTGGVYNAEWSAGNTDRETQEENRGRAPASRENIRRELTELEQKITGIINKRADYNRKRYQDKSRDSEFKPEQTLQSTEQSLRQGMDQINSDNAIDDDRNFYSLMGNISGLGVLDQGNDGRAGRNTDRNSGTGANSISPQKGHLRNLPENEQKREVHSPAEQCQNRDQLDKRQQRLNPNSRATVTQKDKLSTSENNSLKHNNGDSNNGKDRTRNDCTRNHQINRTRYQQLERIRKTQNFKFANTIQRSLTTIRELGQLTMQIAKAITRARRNIQAPKQSLKLQQKQKSQGYSR